MTLDFLLCIECGKKVADVKGEINGTTTWFPVCSECLYNVKGWTKKDFDRMEKKSKMLKKLLKKVKKR
jgi:uncharacterized protein with PIN domain